MAALLLLPSDHLYDLIGLGLMMMVLVWQHFANMRRT
jgi:hypothetical protein